MKKLLSCQIPPEAENCRLEWALKHLLGLRSQEISRAKFRPGGICVNREPCKVTKILKRGDLVEVCLEEAETGSVHLVATPGELHILYEDADILVVDKPAGLVCHPAGGHYADTLANIMQYYFREKGEQVVIRQVGRLDRETSGIVLAAKSQAAAARLNRQKEQGILKKEYLALVEGNPQPSTGWIDAPIGPCLEEEPEGAPRFPGSGIRMQVRPDGKAARTWYETVGSREGVSLMRLKLETGRTHQIRVHMAWLGHPLLGDALYHSSRSGQSCAVLHAVRLRLQQPFTGEEIQVEAPVPEIYRSFMKECGSCPEQSFSGFFAKIW